MERNYVREALHEFAEARKRLAEQQQDPDPILRHDRYIVSLNSNDLIFQSMAEDFTRELINSINSFYIRIFNADCWTSAASQFEENERSSLLYEFAEPFFEVCLSSPYSLKNRFIYSTTHLLHQSNKHVITRWKDELPKEQDISYKTLEKIGGKWSRFPNFFTAVGKLDDSEFRRQTRNYRHLSHHRFPLHVDRGLLPHFFRLQTPPSNMPTDSRNGTQRRGVTYEYRIGLPLKIENVLQLLYSQHALARKAFESYWSLLEEQLTKWIEIRPVPRSDSA